MPYEDPDYPFELRIEANIRHDREPHTVSMNPKAKYRGRPPELRFKDEPEQPRRRLRKVIDAHGVITYEVVEN